MKNTSTGIALLVIVLFSISACEKRDFAEGTLSPYMAIQDIRQIHKGEDVQLTSDKLSEATFTSGTVISDQKNGNTPDGMIVIQQTRRAGTHGIAIHVGEMANNYSLGDSLMINVGNKTLKRNGFLYIDGVSESDVERIGKSNSAMVRTLTASLIYQRPNDFESTLVKVLGAEVTPRPTSGETISGVKKILNGADTLHMRVRSESNFSNHILPRNINVTGVLLGDPNVEDRMAVWPLDVTSIDDISDPEIPGNLGDMPLVFAGYCPDPEGTDTNYEYIQLLANTDINFAEIPFSVVTTNNAGANQPNAGAAPGAGWATGGARTLKFNLTEGSVKKGEFFYVGGHQRRISGANSTSLSDLNWIRAIPYGTTGGDGLGNPSTNILANSGNASGMALFVGTNINEASVPIDLVMFGGTGTATVIDSINMLGYRVANNDHYKPFEQATGVAQPFFSMGTNQYRIPHFLPGNVGFFIQLGGTFNTTTRKWDTRRSYNPLRLTKQSAANELEVGEFVTKQIE